ncbi:SDR family oxidoreductase [Mycobacterium sp. ITM-2016-00317]|uniref:SDR family oxidoreductase n=1 Tax=Mycobacterium sp. ITM-2016-00317 TaxID=2099694 RepID=UPI000D4C346B|nr:SDR family oxidoreductase [Mycobacterium sp. ITM-2016-00317]WNG86906.1 SDR family oxidoreductase [Mycobacterium sp. ITM-2016-00317]
MGTYAITGSASGMGAAAVAQLRAQGHTVITVDIKEADVVADLSTPDGRSHAAEQVLTACAGRLDGALLAAGLGPGRGADRPRLIATVNYLGVVDLLQRWRPALAVARNAKVVVVGSNSTTVTPGVPRRAVRALLAGDVDRALRATRFHGPGRAAMVYAASKIAVTRWARRTAVLPEWAGAGIRLNVVAPGAVMTPLLQEQLDDNRQAKLVERFPVPLGGYGDPDLLARWMCFMLSDAADFSCGSVIFIDGGTDALFRADDWPRPYPLRRIVGYLRRYRG